MSLSQLRPLSFGEILDGAFTLYRRHFATLATTSLLVQLPVLAVYALQGALAGMGDAAMIASVLVGLLVFPATLAAFAFGRPALVRLASNAYLGQPVTRADAFAVARKRVWAILATAILFFLAVMVGYVCLIVPGIILGFMFFLMDQVVTLEGSVGAEALSRSQVLTKGAWGRIFGLNSVLAIILYLPLVALMIGLGVGAALLMGSSLNPAAVPALMSGFYMMMAALFAIVQPLQVLANTILYYDRRVRTEALDLQAPAAPSATAFA
jgi:hypothetical protein